MTWGTVLPWEACFHAKIKYSQKIMMQQIQGKILIGEYISTTKKNQMNMCISHIDASVFSNN